MYDCEETETYDVEFALSVIGDETKRILEIACGSGRFLVPMANAGHDVTGLDFDEHMLNRIPAKISGKGNSEEEFMNILQKNMQPVYDSARRQEYEVWNRG